MSQKPCLPLPGFLRAPLMPISFVLGLLGIGVFMSSVTVGSWVEALMRLVGFKRVGPVPAVMGWLLTLGVVLAAPAWLLYSLIGWPGLIVGPLAGIGVVSLFGRWLF